MFFKGGEGKKEGKEGKKGLNNYECDALHSHSKTLNSSCRENCESNSSSVR